MKSKKVKTILSKKLQHKKRPLKKEKVIVLNNLIIGDGSQLGKSPITSISWFSKLRHWLYK